MTKILDEHHGERFALYHGDNVEVIAGMPDGSIDLIVSSPPFPSMYVYSNSPRDVGNTSGPAEMLGHFRFLVRELLRVSKPGRSACIHLTDVPLFKHADGEIGAVDFRGDVIRLFQSEGWVYQRTVTIDKCPQVRAQRTKDRGLLFKSLATDASVMAPVMPDWLVIVRKPGANPDPIRAGRSAKYGNPKGWITQDEWIEWAGAVWYRQSEGYKGGIKETDVLNVQVARTEQDERHLCPLQLGVIERCVKLWSAPGETVLDPFNGIGSTGVRSIELERRYVGIELKKSYYDTSIRYLTLAENARGRQRSMFDLIEDPEPAEAT